MRTGRVLLGLVLTALLATTAPAQQHSSAMKQVGLERTGSGTFNIDVEGADIRTVLKAIAEFSGRNIVVGPGVEGSVKVSLHDVGWQEAMRTVLRSNGLEYVDEGGILRASTRPRSSSRRRSIVRVHAPSSSSSSRSRRDSSASITPTRRSSRERWRRR